MTQILVNDHIFSNKIDHNITVINFLDYITNENINTSGHVIMGVSINQDHIDLASNNPKLLLPLSDIGFLDIVTKSALSLAFEAIQSLPGYIDNINEQILQTTDLLRSGENEEGNLKLADTIDTIELFIQLFTGIINTFNREISNYSKNNIINEVELKLLEIVKEVINAKAIDDISLLCDLLEYELVDNLYQWRNKIVPILMEERN